MLAPRKLKLLHDYRGVHLYLDQHLGIQVTRYKTTAEMENVL